MSIKIKLNHVLQPYAGGQEIVEVNGNNVKECLDNLMNIFPIFHKILFDTDNTLAVLVLFNGETVTPNDLNQLIAEQSELVILPMIQGG